MKLFLLFPIKVVKKPEDMSLDELMAKKKQEEKQRKREEKRKEKEEAYLMNLMHQIMSFLISH